MYQVTFVILHYLAYQDTKECIDSIKENCQYANYQIVLVDNASPNNSYELLYNDYQKDETVTLLKSQENIGFSKGNNIGFSYAKYELKSDFIVMINNDTIIEQTDFIERTIEIFDEKQYAIFGPDIISTQSGGHQNPVRKHMMTKEQVRRLIRIQNTFHILNKLALDKLANTIIDIFKKPATYNPLYNDEHEGIQLHGSCLIFSPKYIEKYDGLDSRTFMYMEEELLYYRCIKNNLKTYYSPVVKILHKEDVSTSMVSKSNRKKRDFIYTNIVKSAKILLATMEEE